MRFLLVGYTVKGGSKEFTSVHGYKLSLDNPIPSNSVIRNDCLSWANSDGESFSYMQINFMQFVSEEDYDSFMEL